MKRREEKKIVKIDQKKDEKSDTTIETIDKNNYKCIDEYTDKCIDEYTEKLDKTPKDIIKIDNSESDSNESIDNKENNNEKDNDLIDQNGLNTKKHFFIPLKKAGNTKIFFSLINLADDCLKSGGLLVFLYPTSSKEF